MSKPMDRNEQLVAGVIDRDAREPMPDSEAQAKREAAEKARDELHAMKLGAFIGPAFERMRRRAEKLERPVPLPWDTVAQPLGGGLWPGVHMLVGNPKSGKSQWALQAALHAAKEGVPVLYVGLELDRVQLVARAAGLDQGRKWSRLYLGENERELAEVEAKSTNSLAGLPFYLDLPQAYGWNARELESRVKAIKDEHADALQDEEGNPTVPVLVVVDFLQLMSDKTGERTDLRQRIQEAAYASQDVARNHNAAVLLVSSTARDNYAILQGEAKNPNAKPPQPLGKGDPARLMGLGKESGEIEYAGHTVLVLAKQPWPNGEPPKDGKSVVWVAIAAIRARPKPLVVNGEKKWHDGWVELKFDGGRFSEPETGTFAG